MPNTLKKLAQAQLGTGDGAVFTVPASTTYTLALVVICNTDTVARTFRLHQVDSGGSSSGANALFFDHPLGPSETVEFARGMVFETGQMLRGLASAAAKVTVSVFGLQVT